MDELKLTEIKNAIILLDSMKTAYNSMADNIIHIDVHFTNSSNDFSISDQGTLSKLQTMLRPITLKLIADQQDYITSLLLDVARVE